MGLVKVKKIYENETFLEGGLDGSINCGLLTQGAKEAWLVRDESSLLYQSLTTEDPKSASAIKGVLVSENGGNAILVDGTLEDFLGKCNGCCGDDNVVVPVYDGDYPEVVAPVAKDYTVTRTDDGSMRAESTFRYDYLGYIIDKTLQRSYNVGTGVSTYTFKSLEDPKIFKADVLVETNRVFTSNVPGALSGAETAFKLTATIDGADEEVTAATLAALVTALNAGHADQGTWSTAGGAIVLTTKLVDTAVLVVAKV